MILCSTGIDETGVTHISDVTAPPPPGWRPGQIPTDELGGMTLCVDYIVTIVSRQSDELQRVIRLIYMYMYARPVIRYVHVTVCLDASVDIQDDAARFTSGMTF